MSLPKCIALMALLASCAFAHEIEAYCNGADLEYSWRGVPFKVISKYDREVPTLLKPQACCDECKKNPRCKKWEWQGLGNKKFACKFFTASASKTEYRGRKGVGQMTGYIV